MGLAACGIQEPATSAASAAEVERLFDDGLEPPTVGITLGSYENRDDAALTARARLAEIIYRAQVTDILPIGADGVAGGWLDVRLGTGFIGPLGFVAGLGMAIFSLTRLKSRRGQGRNDGRG